MLRRPFAAAVALFALTLGTIAMPAHAQENARQEAAVGKAVLLIGGQARAGRSVAEVCNYLDLLFRGADLDGRGVGPSDERLRIEQATAKMRVAALTRFLSHDLDNDGAVTEAELRRSLTPQARKPLRSAAGTVQPTPEQVAATLDKLIVGMKFSGHDADGDGSITVAEILMKELPENRRLTMPQSKRIDPAFDLDGDGTIAREEFDQIIAMAIAELDSDSDGIVSEDETAAFKQSFSAAQRDLRLARQREDTEKKLRQRAAKCPVPPVPEAAKVVHLALLKSPMVSSLAFADRDNLTLVTDIVIDPGRQPIYLLATTGARMILRFSGATDRLVHVVNVGRSTLGFTGIDAERATFFDKPVCITHRLDILSKAAEGERDFLETLIGRGIDRLVRANSVYRISVPGGVVTVPKQIPGESVRPEGLTGPVWKSIPTGVPDGLVPIDGGEVVAPVPLHPYRVPPSGVPRP